MAAELARLRPERQASSAEDEDGQHLSAEIRWVGVDLSIVLRTQKGTLAAHRTLVRVGSCLDLASAAAVVIAAWQGEMRADLGPDLPVSQQRASPPKALLSEASLSATTVTGAAFPDRARRPWQVAMGIVASRAPDFASGLVIEAELGRPQSRLAGSCGARGNPRS